MTVKELVKGIGDINDTYIEEAEETKKGGRGPRFHWVLILAAVLTALLALSAVAVKGNWFGLREMILGPNDAAGSTISLEGFIGTPEYMASQEWQEFLASYDTDGEILQEIGNGIFAPGTSYNFYNVYSQEMADKLDEIAGKYQLKLHTDLVLNLQAEDLFAQVGGDFLGENRSLAAYMYEDGTFHFDGETDLADYGLLDYQFGRCVRGSFTGATLNIGNAADYTQWIYTTRDGITLTLALSPYKGLILADLGDSLVSVNVLAGTEIPQDHVFSSGSLTAEDLERFSDSFRFSVLTPVQEVDADLWQPVPEDTISPEAFYNATGIELDDAQRFYSEFLRDIESGDRLAVIEKIPYPAVVIMPDRTEVRVENALQLMEYYDVIFTDELWDNIMITRYDLERADLFWHDGLVGAANGFIWFGLLEGEGIRVVTVQSESGAAVRPASY